MIEETGHDKPTRTRNGSHCFLLMYTPAVAAQENPAGPARNPIAVVDGQQIYEQDLQPQIGSQLYSLQNQEYEIKKNALDRLMEQKLLEAEAKKHNKPVDALLQDEVNSKVADPTPGEVEAFYQGQKDRLNRPFDQVQAQLAQTLKQARLQQARQQYFESLRQKAAITILIHPPKVEVSYDPGRVRGDPHAAVIIVEFSDFQCPYCKQVQPTLKQILSEYPGKVSLAFRDLPLKQIHPQAQIAAQAGRCAGEQAKFWEFHDLLFSSDRLDRDSLVEHAKKIGLDTTRFDACLNSGKYDAQIARDAKDGQSAGVAGMPGFFINGRRLEGVLPISAFEKVIDEELAVLKHAVPLRP